MNMSSAEYRAQTKAPKKSKYGNRKTVLDGITFDSKAEARYYAELKQREKAGEVIGIEVQSPCIIYGPNQEKVTTYIADFSFWDLVERRLRVVDVKGVETPVFRLKRKLVRAFLGVEIEVIK